LAKRRQEVNQDGDSRWAKNGDKRILFNLRLKRHEHSSLASVPFNFRTVIKSTKMDDWATPFGQW